MVTLFWSSCWDFDRFLWIFFTNLENLLMKIDIASLLLFSKVFSSTGWKMVTKRTLIGWFDIDSSPLLVPTRTRRHLDQQKSHVVITCSNHLIILSQFFSNLILLEGLSSSLLQLIDWCTLFQEKLIQWWCY